MTDIRPDPEEPQSSLRETVEAGFRQAAIALVIAGGIVGLSIYSRPGPPTYDAFEVNGEVVRLNRRSGSLIVCDKAHCQVIYRAGSRIDRRPKPAALPAPAAPKPLPAAPAAGKSAPAPTG